MLLKRQFRAGLWVMVYLTVFLLSQSLALSILVNDMAQRRAVSSAQALELVLAGHTPAVLAIAALLGLPVLFCLVRCRQISWNGLVLPQRLPLRQLLGCFFLGLALNQILSLLILLARVFPFFDKLYQSFAESQAGLNGDGSLQNTVSLLLLMALVVPVYEEVVYRALIFRELAAVTPVPLAILGQALLFAVCHGSLLQGLFGFVLALLLSQAYLASGSLWAPCAIHCGFNTGAYLLQLLLLRLAGT